MKTQKKAGSQKRKEVDNWDNWDTLGLQATPGDQRLSLLSSIEPPGAQKINESLADIYLGVS